MTMDPNATTDDPDALVADTPDAGATVAVTDATPETDAPNADVTETDGTETEVTETAATPDKSPVPFGDSDESPGILSEARTLDAEAAAAAADLFGVDATGESASTDGDTLSAAERQYQEAMAAAQALGFSEKAPTAAIDQEAANATRLAERLGLDEAAERRAAEAAAAAEPTPDEKIAAAETDEILGIDTGDGRAWYVLNTYSGHENKVEENLKRRVESMDVADRIFDVVVPTEEELEIRGGQRRQVQRKLLPGYVLVNMILDDDTWYVVRNTPGVTGFVGAEKPHPLPRQEVAAILKQTRVAEPRVRVGFEVSDMVRVMEGPFQDFNGEVDDINIEKGKVRVMISMFGRDTPVELDFMQVEKA